MRAAVACVVFVAIASTAAAQSVEIAPFGGYRFGWSVASVGDAFVDTDDGGVSFGVVAGFPIGDRLDGLCVEALFSRELANPKVRRSYLDGVFHTRVEVDHYLVGAIQELDVGRARPFIGALLGLTRYGSADGNEMAFTVGFSAGGKYFATKHVGLRIDGRIYMTIVGVGVGAAACSGGCVFAFSVNPAWQADFTAGLLLAF